MSEKVPMRDQIIKMLKEVSVDGYAPTTRRVPISFPTIKKYGGMDSLSEEAGLKLRPTEIKELKALRAAEKKRDAQLLAREARKAWGLMLEAPPEKPGQKNHAKPVGYKIGAIGNVNGDECIYLAPTIFRGYGVFMDANGNQRLIEYSSLTIC